MNGLIDTFGPEQGEGPIGYVRRLALRNGYPNWKTLVRAIEVNPSLNALWTDTAVITRSLGLEPNWLAQVMPKADEGIGLYDLYFWRSVADAVCPACLGQLAYLRQAWSHTFITACPEHQTELIDHCPGCGQQLEQARPDMARCECGFDLRDAESPMASTAHQWISARLQGDMRRVPGIAEIGQDDDYRHLARLLLMLASRFDPKQQQRPISVTRPKTLAESRAFLQPAEWLLDDWPHRFPAHVGERFALGNPRHYSLSGRLGAWYTSLHQLCQKNHAFVPLWQSFSDAVFDHFDGNLRGQAGLTPSAGKRRHYLSAIEAAKEMGMSSAKLQLAIDQGQVRAHMTRQGPNYQISMLETPEIERVQALRSEWIAESKAAERLGVVESVLRTLIRAGVLEVDSSWRESLFKAGPVRADALEPLITRIKEHLTPRECSDSLSFNQLTARRTVDAQALLALYRAIAVGQIQAIGENGEPGLGGIVFATEDIKRYLGSAALSNGMTLPQLERATGWKYEALSHWVDEGFLVADRVELQGKATRVVTIAALANFRREWIPLSEVAKAAGTKSSAMSAKLEAKGVVIHGQKVTSAGVRRGGLVHFTELIQLAGLMPVLVIDDRRVGVAESAQAELS